MSFLGHEPRNGMSYQELYGYTDVGQILSTELLRSLFLRQQNRRRKLLIFCGHRNSCDKPSALEDGVRQYPDGQVRPVLVLLCRGQSVSGFQSVVT